MHRYRDIYLKHVFYSLNLEKWDNLSKAIMYFHLLILYLYNRFRNYLYVEVIFFVFKFTIHLCIKPLVMNKKTKNQLRL